MKQGLLIILLGAILLIALARINFQSVQLETEQRDNEVWQKFEDYCKGRGHSFRSEIEKLYRYEIFSENLKIIEAHNRKNASWKMGISPFMLLGREEFQSLYARTVVPLNSEPAKLYSYKYINKNQTIKTTNWVQQNKVLTDLPDQGTCGSCYAFTTVANLQSINIITRNQTQLLSVQQIIDCSISYGNQGCNGGSVDQSFDYVVDYGIETNQEYPYKSYQGNCKYEQSKADTDLIQNYFNIQTASCEDLQDSLMSQPIAVAVDSINWQHYQGGIFPTEDCGTSVDHSVLLVGINIDSPKENERYWMLQNWWGKSWGENGFIKLQMGNTCGVCLRGSSGELYPSVNPSKSSSF